MIRALDREKIADVYMRRTPRDLYRIMFRYGFDERGSRLFPTQRVDRIAFEADRAIEAIAMVNDLPEIGDLCALGCSVSIDAPNSFGPGSTMLRPNSKSLAAYSGDWTFNKRTDENTSWEPRVWLYWRADGKPAADWKQQLVVGASIHTWVGSSGEAEPVSDWAPR
jgi:hypothetical protein